MSENSCMTQECSVVQELGRDIAELRTALAEKEKEVGELKDIILKRNTNLETVMAHCSGDCEEQCIMMLRKNKKIRDALTLCVDALKELEILMEDIMNGDYKPDCLTMQPTRIALKAAKPLVKKETGE